MDAVVRPPRPTAARSPEVQLQKLAASQPRERVPSPRVMLGVPRSSFHTQRLPVLVGKARIHGQPLPIWMEPGTRASESPGSSVTWGLSRPGVRIRIRVNIWESPLHAALQDTLALSRPALPTGGDRGDPAAHAGAEPALEPGLPTVQDEFGSGRKCRHSGPAFSACAARKAKGAGRGRGGAGTGLPRGRWSRKGLGDPGGATAA